MNKKTRKHYIVIILLSMTSIAQFAWNNAFWWTTEKVEVSAEEDAVKIASIVHGSFLKGNSRSDEITYEAKKSDDNKFWIVTITDDNTGNSNVDTTQTKNLVYDIYIRVKDGVVTKSVGH